MRHLPPSLPHSLPHSLPPPSLPHSLPPSLTHSLLPLRVQVSQQLCSAVREYSCGRQCSRLLACGNHSCQRDCHVVINPPDSKMVTHKMATFCDSIRSWLLLSCLHSRLAKIVWSAPGAVRCHAPMVALTLVPDPATLVSGSVYYMYMYVHVVGFNYMT